MGNYDIALICKNGHKINSSSVDYPEFNSKFCKKCGAEAIDKCQYCGTPIRGLYSEGFATYQVPSYCHECGKPYPWTEEKLKALEETIDLMDELNSTEKEEFRKSAVEISTDNPRTNLAALKIKRMGAKLGKEVWSSTKEILIQIASETALKSMGLK